MTGLEWLAASGHAVWGVFYGGYAGSFDALLIFAVITYVMIQRARAGAPMRQIHPLPGLDALDESIGRATEMGRPVMYTTGLGAVNNPQTITQFPVLAHVATQCARYDTRLIQPNYDPVVYAVNEQIVRESYLEAGRPDAYNSDDVLFTSNDQFAYAGACWQIMQKDLPAAVILYGQFYAESMMLAEMSGIIESVSVGATANVAEIPFFMASCDYCLIAEEMYAASAYLSKEPVLTGTIVGEDYYKFAMFAIIIIGAIWASFAAGHTGITSFFNL
jgi:hypothetical protein